jgi:isopentenyl-diphosphate delta-isomerase
MRVFISGFSFIYKTSVGNGLTEHELDHVFFAISDNIPELNSEEASSVQYISFESLFNEIELILKILQYGLK